MQRNAMQVIVLLDPQTTNGLYVRSVVEGTDEIIAQTATHGTVHRHRRVALGHSTWVGYLHDQGYESFSTFRMTVLVFCVMSIYYRRWFLYIWDGFNSTICTNERHCPLIKTMWVEW